MCLRASLLLLLRELDLDDLADTMSVQSSSKMSMQAEPQVSMRGGGVIGDW